MKKLNWNVVARMAIVVLVISLSATQMILGLRRDSGIMGVVNEIEEGVEMKSLCDMLDGVKKINVYAGGEKKKFVVSDNEFVLILNEFEYILSDSREMPALGVALDDSTREEMKRGLWIELEFEEEQTYADMPFASWLVGVDGEISGFNIIRKYNEKYDGRCYYVDLMNGKSMQKLQSIILDIVGE